MSELKFRRENAGYWYVPNGSYNIERVRRMSVWKYLAVCNTIAKTPRVLSECDTIKGAMDVCQHHSDGAGDNKG